MIKKINFYYTPKDWELGIGISFPSKSKDSFIGSKIIHYFSFHIFIGPFTISIGDEPVEILNIDKEKLKILFDFNYFEYKKRNS